MVIEPNWLNLAPGLLSKARVEDVRERSGLPARVLIPTRSKILLDPIGEKFLADTVVITRPDKEILYRIHTSDCLGVVLFFPQQNVAVLSHLGWKNLVFGGFKKIKNFLERRQIVGQGSQVFVWVGPHICQDCYYNRGVKRLVKDFFMRLFGYDEFVRRDNGRSHYDLLGLFKKHLKTAGWTIQNFDSADLCTFENGQLPSRRRCSDSKELAVYIGLS